MSPLDGGPRNQPFSPRAFAHVYLALKWLREHLLAPIQDLATDAELIQTVLVELEGSLLYEVLAQLDLAVHLEAYRVLVLVASGRLATRQRKQSDQAQLAIDVKAAKSEKEELD